MGSSWRGEGSRRAFLAAAGGALLAACSGSRTTGAGQSQPAAAAPSTAGTRARTTTASPSTPARDGTARVVRHADTGRPEVALTFHGSGDPVLADRLLTEVERTGALVTVFAVGSWLDQHPGMAGRIRSGGHALGNHTYTHPTLHRLSANGIRGEVARCAAVIARLTGTPGVAFRPSGGPSITPAMVSAATASGYPLVLGYDVDPADNLDPGAAAVADRVLSQVGSGSVVSLHLGHAGTVEALPRILSGLQGRGLRAVTAPVLVAP